MADLRLTNKLVKEYLEIREEAADLERRARICRAREHTIRDAAFAAIDANKGKPVKKGRHTLKIVEKQGRVKWREAYMNDVGAAAAEELVENAEPRRTLEIT